MSHYQLEEWQAYINDEVAEEVRLEYEEHLATCDKCFETYLEAVSASDSGFPDVNEKLTDEIVRYVDQQAGFTIKKKDDARKKSLIHYFVAASLTLIFTFSGLFNGLVEIPSYIKAEIVQKDSESLTEKLLNKRMEVIKKVEQKEGEK